VDATVIVSAVSIIRSLNSAASSRPATGEGSGVYGQPSDREAGTGEHDNMSCMPAASASSLDRLNFLTCAMTGYAPSVVCSDVYTDENDNNVHQRNVYVLVVNYTITK